jgi:uncharacterized protein YndB with AHSA1/START domain
MRVSDPVHTLPILLEEYAERARNCLLSCSLEISADPRRIQYALTLPEYLELWITPADAAPDAERSVMRSGARYWVDYWQSNGEPASISGTFRNISRERIALSWRRNWPSRTSQSFVTVSLARRTKCTHVKLTHRGFMQDAEFQWIRKSWSISLLRLKHLFEQTVNIAFSNSRLAS